MNRRTSVCAYTPPASEAQTTIRAAAAPGSSTASGTGWSGAMVVDSAPEITRHRCAVCTVNLSGSYTLTKQHSAQSISISAFNLTNRLYFNHLSFIKGFVPEIGRGVRLVYTIRFF